MVVRKNGPLDKDSEYYPNGYTSQPDRKNNAERVRILDVEDNERLEIKVTGHAVFNQQNFSLVISGCFGGTGNDINMTESVYEVEEFEFVQEQNGGIGNVKKGFDVLTGVVQ